MHDCFGNSIEMLDKVRPATKEELERAGHQESPVYSAPLFSGTVVAVAPGNTCCEVTVLSREGGQPECVGLLSSSPAGAKQIVFLRGVVASCQAVQLVKLEPDDR